MKILEILRDHERVEHPYKGARIHHPKVQSALIYENWMYILIS